MKKINLSLSISIFLLAGFLLLAGCGGESQEEPTNDAAMNDTEDNEVEAVEEMPAKSTGPGEYLIPEQYASLENPIPADEDSLTAGQGIYEASCERCHGAEGNGDGSSAVQNDLVMIDFSNENVAALSDGELFYIISNGVADAPMEGWDIYNEELRWHLVNYVRLLQGE